MLRSALLATARAAGRTAPWSRGLLQGSSSVQHSVDIGRPTTSGRMAMATRFLSSGAGSKVLPQYEDVFRRSIEDPQGFWAEQAEHIAWHRPFDKVFDGDTKPAPRWFVGGELNTCYNALDVHVMAGRGSRTALIFESAMTGARDSLTYAELLTRVAQCAGMLAELGVQRGDAVVLYMPNLPEALITMLACARLGAVHSVVFGGFAPHELAVRIEDIKPKVVVYASCGIEPQRVIPYKPLVEKALELCAHKPHVCVVLERPQAPLTLGPREIDWRRAVDRARPAGAVPVRATDPLYVLYTSGTTGRPKGVVRDNGGHAVALRFAMQCVFDAGPDDVFWAASDVGWVVGHSFSVYGPLLRGCTTVLFEGKPIGTPDAGAFWRLAKRHHVTHLFTAPTALRAIKREDPEGRCIAEAGIGTAGARLRAVFVAGERSDPDTVRWAQQRLRLPIVDNYWQTETGWPITAACQGLADRSGAPVPVRVGAAGRPVPGYDVHVLDEGGQRLPVGKMGTLAVKLPLPPGAFFTLHNDPERFLGTYMSTYPGYYNTFDAGLQDAEGYLHVMTRIDDVLNVAGHRLSTGEMEAVICAHPDVAECAVVAAPDELKGQVPVGLVVLKTSAKRAPEQIIRELVQRVRDEIGAIACFRTAVVVPRLPKTRSGKILRGTMRKIAANEPWTMPATIEDPVVLQEIQAEFDRLGYGKHVKPAEI